jgi:hypothetical protein
MRYLILKYDSYNENSNNVLIDVCPYCGGHFLRIYNRDKRFINKPRIIKCDICNKNFSENKLVHKNMKHNDIYVHLDESSSDLEKSKIFELLKKNQFSFTTTKNTDEGLINFLKRRYIIIDINKELTYKNIFDYLNNTTYEDCHCHSKSCDNETIFNGFKSLDRHPRGYHKFCNEKCFHEWFSEKQKGSGNTSHRMDPCKIQEYRKKLSDSLKLRIANGEFKPTIHNSWHNTKYKVVIKDEIKNFRSSWEAFFNLVNPDFNYETIRIPYVLNGEKHTYIVDFEDVENRILFEIKPMSLENTERNQIKRNALNEWCNDNNYGFKIINDDWFKINYAKFQYLLEYQPEKIRIMKNLRRYENKKNK